MRSVGNYRGASMSIFREPPRGQHFIAAVVACGVLVPSRADAQVVEPNGVQVPGPSANPNETSLQSYFDTAGEKIDAVAQASTDPGVFSPLCNFTATLVLSQSSATAGLAWYNVPADPTATPVVHPIGPAAATVGQVITSGDIISDPNYQSGLVGFALMKNLPDPTPVYYSEYRRNVFCSMCSTPGYWKMSLTYQSSTVANAYYLAFEDWEGANDSTWFGNDGDFNDKVFEIQGVTCTGGGQPCQTSGLGLCKPGLTECGLGGALVCKPTVTPSPEKCDNVDNDCNGTVDDGNLCDPGYVCQHGTCVGNCLGGEFPCPGTTVCDRGFCIDAACRDKTCDVGTVCRAGNCVAACDGVTCPLGQNCDPGSGRCENPCDGVECAGDEVCEQGVCVAPCGCRLCPTGLECDKTSGRCVAPGCGAQPCPAGQACAAPGTCVDPCAGAACPGGAACENGICKEPAADPGTGIVAVVPDGGTRLVDLGTGGTSSGSSSPPARSTPSPAKKTTGCGCRVSGGAGDRDVSIGALVAGAFVVAWQRRKRRFTRRLRASRLRRRLDISESRA